MKSPRDALSLAACALLGIPPAPAMAADDPGAAGAPGTYGDVGGLLYREKDRVSVNEGVFHVHHVGEDDSLLDVQLVYDALSGGSPNGALPSHAIQTFATPSGRSLDTGGSATSGSSSSYQTCTTPSGIVYSCGSGGSGSTNPTVWQAVPGALPLDKTFTDQRAALSVDYDEPQTPTLRLSTGGSYSRELDYQSMSLHGGLAQDFDRHNTTLSLGLNAEHDISSPIGGTPVPLSNYSLFARQADGTKDDVGALLGVTQVLARNWLTRLNLSADRSHGYQNDPYKIVSGLDANGDVVGYIYENRPAERQRESVYWENRVVAGADTMDLAARAMRDDWGIRSGTLEFSYRHAYGDGRFVEPSLRWYRQTAADFYRLYVLQGDPYLPAVSADPRLGEFTAKTVGLRFGKDLDANTEVSVRVQFYRQDGTVTQPVLADLKGLDLYPGLIAYALEGDLQIRF